MEALQALAKQYPCSCISRIAPYRQGPQSLKCLPHCNLWAIQIYMLSDQKMYIFSNYYTTIRPIWIKKKNLKESYQFKHNFICHKTRYSGMWFQLGHPEVEWRTRYLVCYILVIKNVLTSVCVCFKSFYHSYVCFWNWQRQVGKFIPRIQRNPN